MKKLLVLLLLFFSTALPAEIYKWVDERGEVHFTDEPRKGAEAVELKPATIFHSAPVNPPAEIEVTGEPEQVPIKPSYDNITIMQPMNDQAVRSNGQGNLDVVVASTPDLNKGDNYRVSLDGILLEQDYTSNVISLNNLVRGTHTLSVDIVDGSGKTLLSSAEVSFHMLRN
ncbi:MAG: DUF4124 domain-containing protein [Gammaproteobacteria bacterium]|nr:DUF4124 domain-containing protein [Gammaproteobacteria bacterium]